MHHALEIQEILFDILHRFFSPIGLKTYDPVRINATSNLAALARTCRALKEPALDVLWKALPDLSPLARCLPDASQKSPSEDTVYSFTRPLTQAEWDTLRSYARRIQLIQWFESGLDWESVAAFVNPPATEPFFPNLCTLGCLYAKKTMPLLDPPLPSLLNLLVTFEDQQSLPISPSSFPNSSPNVKTLAICVGQADATYTEMKPDYFCRWQNLRSMSCSDIILDMKDLVHLSHIPTLTELEFALSTALPPSDSFLVFSKLHRLTLQSESLNPISVLLSQTRLPVLSSLSVTITNHISSRDLASFLTGVPTSNTGHTIEILRLGQLYRRSSFGHVPRSGSLLLDFEGLRPCMALRNLRHMEFYIECNVDLADGHLLTLTSAWPKLEHLFINEEWGWNTISGITPDGLVQLFRGCRLLCRIAVQLDTRGYTWVPPSHAPENLGWTLSDVLSINVVDSAIDVESVPAVAAFLRGVATYGERFFFSAWRGFPMRNFSRGDEYEERWYAVSRQIRS